ncbi:Disease resistance protein [Artemisia annua]|uniref:Disease resistance protein n=1 Tax=Artemisia annua TaxID=35608 RepID=A0A2U1KR04_ARTAN|nr:Disease resistance protein [Artemisia annua]
MGELFAGAVLGKLLEEVIAMIRKTAKFRTELQNLEVTLEEIQKSVNQSSELLGRVPDKEMGAFINYLKDGRELVRKCSKAKSWRPKYANKLARLELKLRSSTLIETQTNLVRIEAILREQGVAIDAIKHALGLDGTEGATPLPRKKIRQLLRELIKQKDSVIV